MKTLLMMLAACALLGTGWARAAEPNCAPQEEGVKVAEAAAKAKPDLSKCNGLKGKDKSKCEKEVRTQIRKNLAVASKALACCKSPKACK